jgi:hypothetical protein
MQRYERVGRDGAFERLAELWYNNSIMIGESGCVYTWPTLKWQHRPTNWHNLILSPWMSDDARASTATLPVPTDARFSMRAILVAMAVVALIAALVGPLVRCLDSDAQIRLLILWAIWLAVAFAWIGNLARRRAQVEELAGRLMT